MELKYNLQHQVIANTAAIANLTTQAADIETDIDSLSERVVNTETDILDLNARTLKRSVTATEPKIVSLATDGSQVNLALGENLSIENNVLNAAGGGGLCLHNVSFYDDVTSHTWSLKILSTEKNPFTSFENMIGKVISVSGSHDMEDGTNVIAIAKDDMNAPAFWYIDNTDNIQRSSDPQVHDFTDTVIAL